MNITCENCGHRIEFDKLRPKFCEQCGQRLDTEIESYDAETIAPRTKPVIQMSAANQLLTEIGRYELIDRIGSGGMGVVYEAREKETGRRVAVKVLSSNLSADPTNVERFVREGRLAAQLSHPRTTFIYEAGEDQDRPYIAMELMPGTTLADELNEHGSLPVATAVDYILDVIDGLIAAHKLDVIHRDVKPSNCFVDTDGRIKVGDFGLSKSLVTDVELTRTGAFMGTPSFAAPEQIRSGQIDRRTDIYAVGATLFMLIANRPPFVGDAMSVTAQIVSEKPPNLKQLVKGVPADLAKIVERALSKNPSERFNDLEAMRRALQPFASKGTSLATVGRRTGAYMLDLILVGMISQIPIIFVSMMMGVQASQTGQRAMLAGKVASLHDIQTILTWMIFVAYFAIVEGFFGRTVGKTILGLRIVNADGQRPGILRAAIRSFVIPGVFAVPLLAIPLRHWLLDQYSISTMSLTWMITTNGIDQFFQLLLPFAICLLSMRASNGYRGIHGFLSGTRVVRMAAARTSEPLTTLPSVTTSAMTKECPNRVGTFRVEGPIARHGKRGIYGGVDETLDRPVWIACHVGTAESKPAIHVGVNRPGRCRWIKGGTWEGNRWDAFESIDGVPFSEFAKHPKLFTWEHTRQCLSDYANELSHALNDDTLPATLDMSQFWVERSGHGRIADVSFAAPNPDAETGEDPGRRARVAYDRLAEVLEAVETKQTLPSSVHDLIAHYRNKPKDGETISWLAGRLKNEMRRLPELKWDSRLGILGITLGVEWGLLSAIMLLFCWIYFGLVGSMPPYKMLIPIAVTVLGLFAIGYGLRGAPVFRFMRIEIQNCKGGLASRTRCGLRYLISWLPLAWMTLTGALVYANYGLTEFQPIGPEDAETAQVEAVDRPKSIFEYQMLAAFIGITVALSMPLLLASAIFSIIRPQRGLQDLLVGTRLVPE